MNDWQSEPSTPLKTEVAADAKVNLWSDGCACVPKDETAVSYAGTYCAVADGHANVHAYVRGCGHEHECY